ncbi:MAG: hypothetical protein K2O03_13320 [Lachnospiraceae bacterium]|nr:hypothetical protein [Lachnospiraceae bacterium]
MRKFKNQFAAIVAAAMTGVMTLGLVATAVPVVNAYAADQVKMSEYTIAVDYENFTATITRDENVDYYVILEVLKDSTGTKVSGTYTYPVVEIEIPNPEDEDDPFTKYGAVIDLSFLKAAKDSYIRVHGNFESATTEPTKINAQPKKISVKYTAGQKAGEEYKAFSINKAALSKAADLASYEYRTLYGSKFVGLDELDQATAEIAGTTIVIRKAAVTTGSNKDDYAPASAEAKVKIPGAPKAPKVTVDYAKNTIKLPKNTQLQVMYTGAATLDVTSTKLYAGSSDLDASSDWSTATAITADNASTYFSVASDGTITPKAGFAFSSTNKNTGNTLVETDFDTYITATLGTAKQTGWIDAGTASTQATILALFKSDEKAAIDDDLAKIIAVDGFTLAVRTKANGKKSASNPSIVTIKSVDAITVAADSNQVTVGAGSNAATLKWTVTKTGIDYVVTGAPFEYKDGDKWKTLKVGTTTVKGAVTSDKEVEIRKAGIKSTKTEEGSFPSASDKIKIKAYVAPVKSISFEVAATDAAKLTAGAATSAVLNIPFKLEIKDDEDKAVTTGMTYEFKKGSTKIEDDTISISGTNIVFKSGTALTEGEEYTITVKCGGRDASVTLKVAAAPTR